MDVEWKQNLLSERTETFRPSLIREILKASLGKKDLLSFAGGLPDPSLLPLDVFRSAIDKVILDKSGIALQYGESQGYLPLREWISEFYYGGFREEVSPSEIIITHGSQQGLDLIGKLFLDNRSRVLTESPTYLGALQAFQVYSPSFSTLTLEKDGVDLSELDEILKKEDITLFYTNPVFQNPSTYTWSESKKRQAAEILDSNECFLVEDEAYRLLDFEGKKHSSISSYRKRKDLCIQLGSFSKIVSPGFRLGWMRVPSGIFGKMILAKQANDLNSNQWSQLVVSEFLKECDWESYLSRIRSSYRERRDLFAETLKSEIPDFEFHIPDGGMFLWVRIPLTDSFLLFEEAFKKGLAFVPGREFFPDSSDSSFLRMNFTVLSPSDMQK